MPEVKIYRNSNLNISLPINLASRTVFRFYAVDNNGNQVPLTGFTSAVFTIYPLNETPIDVTMQIQANGDVILPLNPYWWTFGVSVSDCAIFLDNDYVPFVSGTVAFGIVMTPNQVYAVMQASRNAALINGTQYENPRYIDSSTAQFDVTVDPVTGVATVTVNTKGGTWYTGIGAPSNTLGANGDFYFDTQNYDLYGPKASGVWPIPPISFVTEQELIDGLLTKQNSSEKGQPNGYAPLGSDGKLPSIYIGPTTFPVNSVFGRTGEIIAQSGDYTSAQVGAQPISEKGQINGYAPLDSSAKVPIVYLPPLGGPYPDHMELFSVDTTLTSANQGWCFMIVTNKTFTLPTSPADGETYILSPFGDILVNVLFSGLIPNQFSQPLIIDRPYIFKAITVPPVGLIWQQLPVSELESGAFSILRNDTINYNWGQTAKTNNNLFVSLANNNLAKPFYDRSFWALIGNRPNCLVFNPNGDNTDGFTVTNGDELSLVLSQMPPGIKTLFIEVGGVAVFAGPPPGINLSNVEVIGKTINTNSMIQILDVVLIGIPRLVKRCWLRLQAASGSPYIVQGPFFEQIDFEDARMDATANFPTIQVNTSTALLINMRGTSLIEGPEGGPLIFINGGTVIMNLYSNYIGQIFTADVFSGSTGTLIINDYRPAGNNGSGWSASGFTGTIQVNDYRGLSPIITDVTGSIILGVPRSPHPYRHVFVTMLYSIAATDGAVRISLSAGGTIDNQNTGSADEERSITCIVPPGTNYTITDIGAGSAGTLISVTETII